MLNGFFNKKEGILTQEDIAELKKLKRESYMEEARKLIKEQGKMIAQKEIPTKIEEKY